MNNFYILDNYLFTFLAVLFRIGGFFIVSPIFSKENLPNQLKVLLTLAVAFIVMLSTPVISAQTGLSILVIVIKEFIFGLFMGWTLKIFFDLIAAGGTVIGQQGGFALANLYDPATQSQTNVMAKFLNVMVVLIFISVNGHIILLQTLIESYQIFPVGLPVKLFFRFDFAIKIFINGFILSIRVASPVMTAVLVSYVALGIMAKVAPQMNLFAMSFPVTMIISMMILTLSLDGIGQLMIVEFDQFLRGFLIHMRY